MMHVHGQPLFGYHAVEQNILSRLVCSEPAPSTSIYTFCARCRCIQYRHRSASSRHPRYSRIDLSSKFLAMPLYWLRYRHDNQISVVIELELHASMPGCAQHSMDWMRANSPKATSCSNVNEAHPSHSLVARLPQSVPPGRVLNATELASDPLTTGRQFALPSFMLPKATSLIASVGDGCRRRMPHDQSVCHCRRYGRNWLKSMGGLTQYACRSVGQRVDPSQMTANTREYAPAELLGYKFIFH
jgi:hypothetical protein